MKLVKVKLFVAFFALAGALAFSCGMKESKPVEADSVEGPVEKVEAKPIRVGADQVEKYRELLTGKNIGAVVNHTSTIGQTHLVDSLLSLGFSMKKIFAPEHGFRGTADAGEKLEDGKDSKTGLPVTSLYGKKRKPGAEDLAGLDVIIFDIQDVGARFYTYISTMTYVMEACAENEIPVIVFDRPDPNGHYVDGPVLNPDYQSFVGMHQVPVVHGMTVGEYAQMVNGEGWLEGEDACDLTVIPCGNYDHKSFYTLPIPPSPNLPNIRSIYFYPSLCFFEGTDASIGRGTDKQFQILGAPGFPEGEFTFTPEPKPGAKYPKHDGVECRGLDFTTEDLTWVFEEPRITIDLITWFYNTHPNKESFFNENLFFDKLAGSDELRKQIIGGMSEEDIRKTWEPELSQFKTMRKKYLLYEDFE